MGTFTILISIESSRSLSPFKRDIWRDTGERSFNILNLTFAKLFAVQQTPHAKLIELHNWTYIIDYN